MGLEYFGFFISIHYEILHILGQAPNGIRFDRQFGALIKLRTLQYIRKGIKAIRKTAYVRNRLNASHSQSPSHVDSFMEADCFQRSNKWNPTHQ